jgi:DNA-binding transcriptional ArsR family regulator
MSIRAMAWAWDAQCPAPGAKLVLLKLADHANDEGECWPSQGRIAADCGLTRQTVNEHLKKLVELGLVRCENRFNGTGQLANRYFLLCRETRHPLSGNPTPPLSDIPTPPVGFPDTEPSIEPSKEERTPHTPRKRGAVLEGFEDWYREFPNKVGRGAAERAWPTARKRASLEELIDAVGRYVESKPPDRPWCQPATWLNQKRWLDQPAAAGEYTNGQSRGPDGPPPTVEELRQFVEHRKVGMAR